ncbi:hypothetical protein FRC02_010557 [Tulasnella sp. 418]|nr:hypothetical protein FRC02_010557 [Tulasnella sp. 418]
MSSSTLNPRRLDLQHHYQKVAVNDDTPWQNPPPQSSKSLSYGPPKSIGPATVFPLITVLFWSFGMGSALLVWLLVKRVTPASGYSSDIFDGYLVVEEGNKTGSMETLDGQENLESTMTGVLIITAISHFSSMAVVPLMALGAFYVASRWLDDQAQFKEGPTPLQFGLVLQMCSSGSWDSAFMTLRYLIIRWRRKPADPRTKVSPLVYIASAICIAVVALHYGVVITDLLLSADLGSAYYTIVSEVDVHSSNDTSILGTQYHPVFSGIPTYDTEMARLNQSIDTLDGISHTSRIIVIDTSNSSSIEDNSYMAVIARPPRFYPALSWNASTIGMSARCRPAICNDTDGVRFEVNCYSKQTYPYRPMPLPSFDYQATLFQNSPPLIRGYDASGEELNDLVRGNSTDLHPRNPFYFFMALRLEYPDNSKIHQAQNSEVHQYYVALESSPIIFFLYLGTCEVTLYEVEISFDGTRALANQRGIEDVNSFYRLASPPVPMSPDKAIGVISLASPIEVGYWDYISSNVIPDIGRVIYREQVHEGFSNKVAAEFARQTLAFISATNFTAVPAQSVIYHSVKLLSRYPLARTLAYIGVVYAHGLLAIILFVGIIGKSSKTVIVEDVVQKQSWKGTLEAKKQNPVQELLLVHSRLTDPLAVVAEHFLELESERQDISSISTSAAALSAQKDPIMMFDVEGPNTAHLDVGLIDRQEGERWYGLRHRRKDVLVGLENEKVA